MTESRPIPPHCPPHLVEISCLPAHSFNVDDAEPYWRNCSLLCPLVELVFVIPLEVVVHVAVVPT